MILSGKHFFRIMLAVLLGYALLRVWPILKLLVVAILIATALYTIVRWTLLRGWPRWLGLLLATLILLLIVATCFGLIGPLVYQQAARLSQNLPKFTQDVMSKLPPSVTNAIQRQLGDSAVSNSQHVLAGAVTVGAATVRGILDGFLILVFAIYFLIDGERTLQWLRAFFPQKHQPRISQALSETNDLIVAYTVGQFITSAFAATYVFLLLTILHVPLALLLGILAGIFDVLPVVGVIMAVVPAALMALTVSPTTSLVVILLYSLYHLFENYFIVPKVYGRKLRLSTLTVLLAITIAGTLAGVIGAIVILPLVAAYPVMERLWFGRHLPPHTVPAHEEQAKG